MLAWTQVLWELYRWKPIPRCPGRYVSPDRGLRDLDVEAVSRVSVSCTRISGQNADTRSLFAHTTCISDAGSTSGSREVGRAQQISLSTISCRPNGVTAYPGERICQAAIWIGLAGPPL